MGFNLGFKGLMSSWLLEVKSLHKRE